MNWLIWALLSGLFAALTAIFTKFGVRDVQPDLATAIRTLVIVVIAWPVVWLQHGFAIAQAPRRAWLFLILSGVATCASWICQTRAFALGTVGGVSTVDRLSLVFVLALAAFFLGETISWRQGAGAAMIVVGAVIFVTGQHVTQ